MKTAITCLLLVILSATFTPALWAKKVVKAEISGGADDTGVYFVNGTYVAILGWRPAAIG